MKRTFLVVYAKSKDGYSGYAPDVQGCISAGFTLEEIRVMLREALEGHIELMVEKGEIAPEPSAITVGFPDENFEGIEYFVVEPLQVEVPTRPDTHDVTLAQGPNG